MNKMLDIINRLKEALITLFKYFDNYYVIEMVLFFITIIIFLIFLSIYFINRRKSNISVFLYGIILIYLLLEFLKILLFGDTKMHGNLFSILSYSMTLVVLFIDDKDEWRSRKYRIDFLISLLKWASIFNIVRLSLSYIHFYILEHYKFTLEITGIADLFLLCSFIAMLIVIMRAEKNKYILKRVMYIIFNNVVYSVNVIFQLYCRLDPAYLIRNLTIISIMYILFFILIYQIKYAIVKYKNILKYSFGLLFINCCVLLLLFLYSTKIDLSISFIEGDILIYVGFNIIVTSIIQVISKKIDKKHK
jgi:hypothetical protein